MVHESVKILHVYFLRNAGTVQSQYHSQKKAMYAYLAKWLSILHVVGYFCGSSVFSIVNSPQIVLNILVYMVSYFELLDLSCVIKTNDCVT